jgi:hypothetical protein
MNINSYFNPFFTKDDYDRGNETQILRYTIATSYTLPWIIFTFRRNETIRERWKDEFVVEYYTSNLG